MENKNSPTPFDKLTILIGGYALWVIGHLYLLITNEGSSYTSRDYFWPFKMYQQPGIWYGSPSPPSPTGTFLGFVIDPYYYDLSEFVVYVLVPLIIVVPLGNQIMRNRKRSDK